MEHLIAPLEMWLITLPGFEGARVKGLTAFSGGASNVTCRVDVEGGPRAAVVLRLQRDEGIFAPYDVIREGRVLSALRDAPFPVPEVLASEPDPAPLGAPFLIIEFIDGLHMGQPGVQADYGAFVRAVADIHSLDWRRQGLEFLGVSRDARSALLAEVQEVVRRMEEYGRGGDPLLAAAGKALTGTVPADGELAFCQGDINVFNYLFKDGRLVGVVDWEQAKISDLRGDIGQIVALSHLKGVPFCPPREIGFVGAYEEAAGRPLKGLEWFRAFWLFQLGVIYHGWIAFNDSLPWYSRAEVEALLQQALAEVTA